MKIKQPARPEEKTRETEGEMTEHKERQDKPAGGDTTGKTKTGSDKLEAGGAGKKL